MMTDSTARADVAISAMNRPVLFVSPVFVWLTFVLVDEGVLPELPLFPDVPLDAVGVVVGVTVGVTVGVSVGTLIFEVFG